MFFWLCVLIAVVCLTLTFFDKFDDARGWLVAIGLGEAAASVVMLTAIVGAHVAANVTLAKYQNEYVLLTYQYTSNMYTTDEGMRSLMEDIRDYNVSVIWGKTQQRDLWFGIFFPNIYDQLEIIKIEKE